jgi:hypothetical protein
VNIASLSGIFIILQVVITPACAADDVSIERMATCRDSWLDWEKTDPGQLKNFYDHFRSDFSRSASDPFWVPKADKSIAGLRIEQAFPDSVGMGVGFSVTVRAGFDEVRRRVEKLLGRSLNKCETGENMRTCGLEIADKRTLMVMAEDNPKNSTTLLGCYYYYEK